MQTPRKVAITGLGVITALGVDETSFWDNLVNGRSGIKAITSFDTSEMRTRIGAEVDNNLLAPALEAHGIRSTDRAVDMFVLACAQALKQSGLVSGNGPYTPQPIGIVCGTGNGPSASISSSYAAFAEKGIRGIRPTTITRVILSTLPAEVSLKYKLTGTTYAVNAACTSATIAIGLCWRMIRDGYADRLLACGAEALFIKAIFSAWNNLGVMSRNPDPAKAARPFDRDRDGLLVGEGGGAIMLEEESAARARGAKIRGYIIGYGESSDAAHITHPSVEGQSVALRMALDSAGIGPKDVDFINAHGTGTTVNDEVESQTIRAVFGEHADRIPVVANKAFFGHLMGASGLPETIASILCLEKGMLVPNLNIDNQDPACAIKLAGPAATPLAGRIAVKNSFGFGGTNGVLVISRA